jgi:hypothetical protein
MCTLEAGRKIRFQQRRRSRKSEFFMTESIELLKGDQAFPPAKIWLLLWG